MAVLVSVPSFGDSFFIIMNITSIIGKLIAVSVPSFGDSFFIEVIVDDSSCGDCFRPLIRGFFFY